jgi:hypothetical protein
MIDLKRITKGKVASPPRVLVYAFEGVGKTRFAAGAPEPFFIDTDKGSHYYDVRRVVPETWSEVLEWVDAADQKKVKCESLVVDSVTQLETLGHAEFFPGSSVDRWDGGYGHGDTYVRGKWDELLFKLERVWMQGKPIILVAHATVRRFKDPTGPDYERFGVGLRPSLAGRLTQWADYVLFCREEVSITAPPKGSNSNGKATTSGTRWAYTRRTPAYDAKARGEVLFPERLLLSWGEFEQAMEGEKKRSRELYDSIAVMLEELEDSALTRQVQQWLKEHPEGVLEAHQSINSRLESHRLARQAVADEVPAVPAGA